MRTIIVPRFEFSLDELRERVNQNGEDSYFEYKLGAYYEMDIYKLGEMANIRRLLENYLLPPRETDAVFKMLADRILDSSERKALERGIKRLKSLLLK